MLKDEAMITVEGGKGGDGLASFRREKYVPRGGPDGGDGGKGGDIIIQTDPSTHGLNYYAGHKQFNAEDGARGGKSRKTGKNGQNIMLKVPPGTVIFNAETNEKIIDSTEKNQDIVIAKGGNGGWGNVHFTNSVNQAPTRFNPGKPGELKKLNLELKLIADVGLVGLPNSGKSTLISHLSSARPKIADYPFTTLEPNLGTLYYHNKQFILADIPGLIAGSAQGKGLGDKFLRHIERTKIIVPILDAYTEDPLEDYYTLYEELKAYHPSLIAKIAIIALNKTDLLTKKEILAISKKIQKKIPNIDFVPISAVTGYGLKQLIILILKKLSL